MLISFRCVTKICRLGYEICCQQTELKVNGKALTRIFLSLLHPEESTAVTSIQTPFSSDRSWFDYSLWICLPTTVTTLFLYIQSPPPLVHTQVCDCQQV